MLRLYNYWALMSKERKHYPKGNHHGEPRLGFSPGTKELLRQLSGQENTRPLLAGLQEIELTGAARFLHLAHIGIQMWDFQKEGNDNDQAASERQLRARSITVEVLYPELFPKRGVAPKVISYEEAVHVQRRVQSYRNVLYAIVEGQILPPPSRLLLPQIVDCFDRIQQRTQRLPTPAASRLI